MKQSRRIRNLEDWGHIQHLDRSNMTAILLDFPDQLRRALSIIKTLRLYSKKEFSNIVFTGVGGSAIGGEVAKSCLADEIEIPFIVNRDYFVPRFVNSKTLLFVNSYSGNTEETLSAYKNGRKKKAKIIVITSGGKLAKLAKKDGYPTINIPAGMPPRCALAYSFVPAIVAISKIGLVKNKQKDIEEAARVLAGLRDRSVGPNIAFKENEAKKIAFALYGRFCAIYSGLKGLGCVVTRWRGQLAENSKSLATSHSLPEMNHNEIMGFNYPERLIKDMVVVFLEDKGDYIRIRNRIKITRSILEKKLHKVIKVNSKGNGLIARICSLIYIGDFVSFYLAVLNNEDPTPVDEIACLKKELSKRGLA